ncbi:hypothetical protein Sru01_12860 [Sphaerisporangium rufum]|uniref:Histidine kinase/HSP90-like ATPase domain-containing protein n=1 Tax=Sphaerisporangium rufum TaxID=1381558 RepID=A0A919UXX5_9ACTN|nr:ATP-binding protein [Sphaerisporangium rufum]GII76304.1 hypothetical protein Sru01_12860 [Sphaerisporangium rufum]
MAAEPCAPPDCPDGEHPGPASPGAHIEPRTAGHLVWHRAFPGTPDQAARARAFVRFLLSGLPCADEAELIVSELAGNALRHTRSAAEGGWFAVEVTLTPGSGPDDPATVVITVDDCGGGGVPSFTGRSPVEAFAESGRGLATVAALAARTGYHGSPATGHRVWAVFALRAARAGSGAI